MAVGWGGTRLRSLLFLYFGNIKKTFSMRLLYCFWNNFRLILCENIVLRLSWNSETAANSRTLGNSGNRKTHLPKMTISAEKVSNVYVYVHVITYVYMCMYMCICTCIFLYTYVIYLYNILMKQRWLMRSCDCTRTSFQNSTFGHAM